MILKWRWQRTLVLFLNMSQSGPAWTGKEHCLILQHFAIRAGLLQLPPVPKARLVDTRGRALYIAMARLWKSLHRKTQLAPTSLAFSRTLKTELLRSSQLAHSASRPRGVNCPHPVDGPAWPLTQQSLQRSSWRSSGGPWRPLGECFLGAAELLYLGMEWKGGARSPNKEEDKEGPCGIRVQED